MVQYLNNNDVLVIVAPQCTEEDRFAAAELQAALGDNTKVVLFTSQVYFDTLSVNSYDMFPTTGPEPTDYEEAVEVADSPDDNILNFPKTI